MLSAQSSTYAKGRIRIQHHKEHRCTTPPKIAKQTTRLFGWTSLPASEWSSKIRLWNLKTTSTSLGQLTTGQSVSLSFSHGLSRLRASWRHILRFMHYISQEIFLDATRVFNYGRTWGAAKLQSPKKWSWRSGANYRVSPCLHPMNFGSLQSTSQLSSVRGKVRPLPSHSYATQKKYKCERRFCLWIGWLMPTSYYSNISTRPSGQSFVSTCPELCPADQTKLKRLSFCHEQCEDNCTSHATTKTSNSAFRRQFSSLTPLPTSSFRHKTSTARGMLHLRFQSPPVWRVRMPYRERSRSRSRKPRS